LLVKRVCNAEQDSCPQNPRFSNGIVAPRRKTEENDLRGHQQR
jgi:hypothetical protein